MSKLPWWTMSARYPDARRIVIVADEGGDPVRLLDRLFEGIEIVGTYAMQLSSVSNAAIIECQFENAADYDKVSGLFKAREIAPHAVAPGKRTFELSKQIQTGLFDMLEEESKPRQNFVPHPVDRQVAHDWVRPLCRWWLELSRNVVVVAGLFWLADKTKSKPLMVFAGIGVAALFLFIQSYFGTWHWSMFPNIRRRRLNFVVNGIPWVILSVAALCLVMWFGETVFNDLKVLQR